MNFKLIKAAPFLLFLFFAKSALAAPDLMIGDASGDPGEAISIPLTLSNGAGETASASMLIDLTFDSSVLSLSPDADTFGTNLENELGAALGTVAVDTSTSGRIGIQTINLSAAFALTAWDDVSVNMPMIISGGAVRGESRDIIINYAEFQRDAAGAGAQIDPDNFTLTEGTVTIDTLPLPEVSIEATIASASEPSTAGSMTITRTGDTASALSVLIDVTGDATIATDYTFIASPVIIPVGEESVVVPVTPIDDGDIEDSESVIVTIEGDAAYDVSATADSAEVVIADDDAPGFGISLDQGDNSIAPYSTDSFGSILVESGDAEHIYTLNNATASDITVAVGLSETVAAEVTLQKQINQFLEALNPIGAAWAIGAGDFSVDPSSVTVPAGGSATFTIAFDPSETGTREAQVDLSAGGTQFFSFKVAGIGSVPVAAGAQNIPTMSEWMMILLLLTLFAVAIRMSSRRS